MYILRRAVVIVCATSALFALKFAHAQRVAATTTEPTSTAARVTVHVDRAPLSHILEAIAQRAGLIPIFERALIPPDTRVTLHLQDVSAEDAFQQALRGTGLAARIQKGGYVAIVRDVVAAITGTITGTVTDAKTGRPLGRAQIALDGVTHAATGDDGTYRIPAVDPGAHTLTVKLLGYSKALRRVTVSDNVSLTVNVALDAAATSLAQVVVTGTVIPTELKAVPNAMTVITAKQIEERGITHIDQLFRGDVPGLFAQNIGSGTLFNEVTMFSRGATALSAVSAGTSANGLATYTNTIKTYVDGIEMADPKYLSQIDPKSIERIEILTGPQASTIYGSNAINGVMQIFTKRGTTNTPQLTLNLLSGWVENNFSSARTPQHDYSAQVSGIEGRLSYNGGSSWQYMGPWTPAKQTSTLSGSGGVRADFPTILGRITADVTLRRSNTQNHGHGDPYQTQTHYGEAGWYKYNQVSPPGLRAPSTSTLNAQTVGTTITYVPWLWWSHEFGGGIDQSDMEIRVTARSYATPGFFTIPGCCIIPNNDTTLSIEQTHNERRSLRYTTTARVPLASVAQATVTLGADTWQNLISAIDVSPQTLTGTLTNVTSMTRQPGHNTGSFLQMQLGVEDQLFLTYGLRAEWNPNFGADAQPNYAPRYGAAYAREVSTPLGALTTKLRASYGRATRPPDVNLKVAESVVHAGYGQDVVQDYGNFDYFLANQTLGPEYQRGGEGGLELYFGARGSLVVTRYNQTVSGLISNPLVDSVRSFTPDPLSGSFGSIDSAGYGYAYQYQYVNLGSIRNQGWELQGSVNTGPFTTKGTYSWTKSRVLGVTPRYRSFFATDPRYQPGATFDYLPEHTWAAGITYSHAQTTVALNITGVGQLRNLQNDLYIRNFYPGIRLQQNRSNMSASGGKYISFNHGYALADLSASRRLSSHAEGIVQVQNLTDHYVNDYVAGYATLGRQAKAGIRAHF